MCTVALSQPLSPRSKDRGASSLQPPAPASMATPLSPTLPASPPLTAWPPAAAIACFDLCALAAPRGVPPKASPAWGAAPPTFSAGLSPRGCGASAGPPPASSPAQPLPPSRPPPPAPHSSHGWARPRPRPASCAAGTPERRVRARRCACFGLLASVRSRSAPAGVLRRPRALRRAQRSARVARARSCGLVRAAGCARTGRVQHSQCKGTLRAAWACRIRRGLAEAAHGPRGHSSRPRAPRTSASGGAGRCAEGERCDKLWRAASWSSSANVRARSGPIGVNGAGGGRRTACALGASWSREPTRRPGCRGSGGEGWRGAGKGGTRTGSGREGPIRRARGALARRVGAREREAKG